MRQITFLLLTIILTRGIAQTNTLTLQNVNWTLLHISDKQSGQTYKCFGRLIFNSDSTISGHDGCNKIVSIFPAVGPKDISSSSVSSYSMKEKNLLTINNLYTTSVACFPKDKDAVNVPDLLHKSLLKTYAYKINADTLIISCTNNIDLFYLKNP